MPNEAKKTLIRPVALAAAIVGTIECLFWFIGSLLLVLIHTGDIDIDIINVKDDELLAILTLFLLGPNEETLVNPKVFNIFMCVYIVLSSIGLIVSSVMLWGMIREKWRAQWKVFVGWSVIIIATSILDLTLLGMVAADFNKYKNEAVLSGKVAFIIVMTLAARGYILWIANVVFAAIILKFAFDLQRNKQGQEQRRTPIDAYATGALPPWQVENYLYEETKTLEFTNRGYEDDDNTPAFSRSQSFFNVTENAKNSANPLANRASDAGLANGQFIMGPGAGGPNEERRTSPSVAGRFAKIGKLQQPGRMTPPTNVPPPFIPDPDYTPPGSLRRKSVLKPTSNYVL